MTGTTSRKDRILKSLADSKVCWGVVLGPIYNRAALRAFDYQDLAPGAFVPPENARILDVGSGPGYIDIMLAERFPTASITGVDYSPNQVRYSNRLLSRKQVLNCKFVLGDAMELPFEDASFDIVISIASIKYWPDKVRGLREIRRVLASRGSAFIGEGDVEADKEHLDKFIREFNAWYVPNRVMARHLRKVIFGQSINLEQAEKLCREAGFADVRAARIPGKPFLSVELRN